MPAIPMRLFTIIVSTLFVVIGIWGIATGDTIGWLIGGFFGLCLLIAIFEPWLPRPRVTSGFRILVTQDEVACEHRKRPRESIRWEDVIRIWYVTTSEGPYLPDEWMLFEGESGGCSFPTEAEGMEAIWDELERRFAGFDFGPIIRGGTNDARHLCWERKLV